MVDGIVKTALRVPIDLHRRIHVEAKKSGRTFNAEIVFGMMSRYDMQPEQKNAPEVPASGASDQ